jgi:hypothetical protein
MFFESSESAAGVDKRWFKLKNLLAGYVRGNLGILADFIVPMALK